MKSDNNKSGEVKIFLSRDFFNSLISVLSSFISADENNKYSIYARKMKETIMRYAFIVGKPNNKNALINLYADEAATLVKLLAIYINASGNLSDDYFSLVEKKKKSETEFNSNEK